MKSAAARDCVTRYGLYVDYAGADAIGPHDLDEEEFSQLTAGEEDLEGTMRAVADRVALLERSGAVPAVAGR